MSRDRTSNTGDVPRGFENDIPRERDMAAYDGLPRVLRDRIKRAYMDYSPVTVAEAMEQFGTAETLRVIDQDEAMHISRDRQGMEGCGD